MSVNENINLKQYKFVPFIGIALIVLGFLIGPSSLEKYDFEGGFSFELSRNAWTPGVTESENELDFVSNNNPIAHIAAKKLPGYVFGVADGHSLYMQQAYESFEQEEEMKEIEFNGEKAYQFSFTYSLDGTPMSAKEFVFTKGEELYLIGGYAPQAESNEYLSSFEEIVNSVELK